MKRELPGRTLGFVVSDVARLLRRRFDRRARARTLGLTRAQAFVLAQLAREEGISQATLAQRLDVEPITLARLVDKLEAAGLIERRRNRQDRRAYRLYLSEAASPLLDEIFAIAAEVREEALVGLDEAERAQLIEALLAIKANLLTGGSAVGSSAIEAEEAAVHV